MTVLPELSGQSTYSSAVISWSTTVRGIHTVGTHEVIPIESGTRSVLTIEMSGWIATLLVPLMRGSVEKAIQQKNEGLKGRCEGEEG